MVREGALAFIISFNIFLIRYYYHGVEKIKSHPLIRGSALHDKPRNEIHGAITTLSLTQECTPTSPTRRYELTKSSLTRCLGNAENRLDLLEDDELQTRGGCEASPDGDESLVQSAGASVFYDLHEAIGEAVVDLGIRWLVHELGAHHIEGRHGGGHGHDRAADHAAFRL